jgi:ATP-dependent protease Clp ATPase subunit
MIATQMAQASCSFCAKPRTMVGDLIAHERLLGAYICDKCIKVCSQILAEQKSGAAADPTVSYRPEVSPDARTFRKSLFCSFCEQSQDNVRYLISSPSREKETHYICDRCVGISEKLLLRAKDVEERGGWGRAEWLRRALGSRPGRLHRLR